MVGSNGVSRARWRRNVAVGRTSREVIARNITIRERIFRARSAALAAGNVFLFGLRTTPRGRRDACGRRTRREGAGLTPVPKCWIGTSTDVRRRARSHQQMKLVRTAWVPLRKRLAPPHRPHLRSRAVVDTSRRILAKRLPPAVRLEFSGWPRWLRIRGHPRRRVVPCGPCRVGRAGRGEGHARCRRCSSQHVVPPVLDGALVVFASVQELTSTKAATVRAVGLMRRTFPTMGRYGQRQSGLEGAVLCGRVSGVRHGQRAGHLHGERSPRDDAGTCPRSRPVTRTRRAGRPQSGASLRLTSKTPARTDNEELCRRRTTREPARDRQTFERAQQRRARGRCRSRRAGIRAGRRSPFPARRIVGLTSPDTR